jgi:hypothetical protein
MGSGGDVPQHKPERLGKRAAGDLEHALRTYEDVAAIAEALSHVYERVGMFPGAKRTGAVTSWRKARDFLLGVRPGETFKPGALDQFAYTPEQIALDNAADAHYRRDTGGRLPGLGPVVGNGVMGRVDQLIVPQLAAWTRDSRRVVSIDEESFKLFWEQDYSTFSWEDIEFPMQSFLIELPQRIGIRLSDTVTVELSSLLVTSLGTDPSSGQPPSFECRLFFADPTEADRRVKRLVPPSMVKAAEEVTDGFNKKKPDMDAIRRFLQEKFIDDKKGMSPYGINVRIDMSKPIDTGEQDILDVVKKTIAGLSLYLAHAQKGTLEPRGETYERVVQEEKKVHPRRPTVENVIRDRSEVLAVRGLHAFNPRTGTFTYTDRGTGEKKTAHAVRAHYKRPVGAPAGAPRTKRIESYWRNVQTLPEQVLPGGSVTVVSQKR